MSIWCWVCDTVACTTVPLLYRPLSCADNPPGRTLQAVGQTGAVQAEAAPGLQGLNAQPPGGAEANNPLLNAPMNAEEAELNAQVLVASCRMNNVSRRTTSSVLPSCCHALHAWSCYASFCAMSLSYLCQIADFEGRGMEQHAKLAFKLMFLVLLLHQATTQCWSTHCMGPSAVGHHWVLCYSAVEGIRKYNSYLGGNFMSMKKCTKSKVWIDF